MGQGAGPHVSAGHGIQRAANRRRRRRAAPDVSDGELASSIAELERLARTLGLDPVGRVTQRRSHLAPGVVLGEDKLAELAAWTGGTGVVPAYEKPGRRKPVRDAADDAAEDDDDDGAGAEAPDEADAGEPAGAALHGADDAQVDDLSAAERAGATAPDARGAIGATPEPRAQVVLVDHSLTIVDRGFLSARILLGIERGGSQRHWLTRAKSTLASTRIERFAVGDELIELNVSKEARQKDPSMPATWRMRAIRYQRRGFPPQVLLTSLLDPKRYPAAEIVALYHERWEIELGYNEVKRVMLAREESTRSKSPRGVAQELWGLGIAYNLVRYEAERVAADAGVSPTRISFVAALNFIESALRTWGTESAGRLPERLQRLREDLAHFVLPERRERSYPRAVKIKMSNYARKRPAKSSSRSRAK